MSVTVSTQEELDQALADRAALIYIKSPRDVRLRVSDSGSSRVVAGGSSHVEAWGSSHVEAWGSSHVEAGGSSRVEAGDSSRVEAWDSSRVEAWGSSRVVAGGSSRVVAGGSSHVEAWDSSHVEAWDSSHVVARGSSHVVAWGSSRVVAWGSSRVVAWGSSHVEAWGSSHVVAGRYNAVHLHSRRVRLSGNGHVIDLTGIDFSDPVQWCDFNGVEVADGVATVYKAVGDDWKSDYGTSYEAGSLPQAPDWSPHPHCGNGLHFCAHPQLSLLYKSDATRFVKCGVRMDEMVCLGDKIKAKRVVVPCVEVDRYGHVKEVEA